MRKAEHERSEHKKTEQKKTEESRKKEDSNRGRKADHEEKRITGSRLTALVGVFIALALILSYLESMIPVNAAVPGIKLGIANIVTIVALCRLGVKPAVIVSAGRILLTGILFGNITMILYSFAGAALSMLVMTVVMKIRFFTVTGVSICGALAHNLGQILAAVFVMENANIMYYLPVLILAGAAAGTLTGLLAGIVLKNIRI